jgi:hypothetical protein
MTPSQKGLSAGDLKGAMLRDIAPRVSQSSICRQTYFVWTTMLPPWSTPPARSVGSPSSLMPGAQILISKLSFVPSSLLSIGITG